MPRFVAFVLCVLAPITAAAQTATYQNRLLGQRAPGMGGAFTGIADDPSAAYYNPAALSNLSTLQLEVGLPVVAIDQLRVFGGLVRGSGSNSDSLVALALPTMIGAAAGVGPKDGTGNERLTLALSLLIPWQRQVFLRQALQVTDASAVHIVQESEQTLMLGASLSVRLGIFSIGASLFYIHQNVFWLTSQTGTASACGVASCTVEQAYNHSTQLEGWFGAFSPRLGLLLKPTPQWSIGLMASLSSFRMFGAGGFKTGGFNASDAGVLGQQFYATDHLWFDRPLPWELRVGVGFKLGERFVFAGDVTFYMPQNFPMLRGVPTGPLIFPADIRRGFVMNGNLGFEYKIRPTIPLRFGLFTNLSAAPRVQLGPGAQSVLSETAGCADTPCMPWQHSAGITSSVGAQLWRVQLDFGAIVSYGRGYMQQNEPQGPTRFRWAETDQIQVQLFIGGNLGKVLNETAIEIKERIEQRQRELEEKKQHERDAASQPLTAPPAPPPP